MKTLSFFIITLFSLVSLANRESGAGGKYAAQFATAGVEALKLLAAGDSSLGLEEIFKTIKKVKIIPQEDSSCQRMGEEYVCSHARYSKKDNAIYFNQIAWDSYYKCEEKLMLASHEYLRASGLEGESYFYSGRFLNREFVPVSNNADEDWTDKSGHLNIVIDSRMEDFCQTMGWN